jgi:hypothetical protein
MGKIRLKEKSRRTMVRQHIFGIGIGIAIAIGDRAQELFAFRFSLFDRDCDADADGSGHRQSRSAGFSDSASLSPDILRKIEGVRSEIR